MFCLKLYRLRTEQDATLGVLELGSPIWKKFATLEPNPSVIPAGSYDLRLELSPKFHRQLWELKNVPGHSELKFHNGNTAENTQGCPLLGLKHGHLQGKPAVLNSRAALEAFMRSMPGTGIAKLEVIDIGGE